MYEEVVLNEPVGNVIKGARGKILAKFNDSYFVDFSKDFVTHTNPTYYLWAKHSKVETMDKKSNFIGE